VFAANIILFIILLLIVGQILFQKMQVKKAGFTEIYILKKGYAAWKGKVKIKEAR
jgi:hypothetical protein